MSRVKKLMALAQSQNQYEAESAMSKARNLMALYNQDLLEENKRSNFVSIFIGRPSLRHTQESYQFYRLPPLASPLRHQAAM